MNNRRGLATLDNVSIVLRWDGQAWTEIDVGPHPILHDVWARSRNDIWIVGDNGTLLHYAP